MIDWLTLILDTEHLNEVQRSTLQKQVDLVVRYSAEGEVKDILTSWKSLRSDTTGCTIAYSPNQLTICGSPASLDQSNNVFGTDDIIECFHKFRKFIAKKINVWLPNDIRLYRCTRIDITYNYFLGGQDEVENALGYLKYANTRGQNVQRKGTTVYWNKRSNRRSAKAYNKYKHAKVMLKDFKHAYKSEDLENLKNILRLELKLGSKYLKELDTEWHEMTAEILQFEHERFFKQTVGSVDVPTKTDLLQKLIEVSLQNELIKNGSIDSDFDFKTTDLSKIELHQDEKTKLVNRANNQAKAAFNTFTNITNVGFELAKSTTTKSTWYRHVKLLKDAGLSVADINSGEILPFRRKTITLGEPVNSWSDLANLAKVN